MSKRSGFTIIEVLVAATIIAVLTTIGIVSFRSTNLRARDGKRKADMEQVRAALELYRSDTSVGNGYYPNVSNNTSAINSFTVMVNALATAGYLSQPVPADPVNTGVSKYSYWSLTSLTNPTTYCVCALLEGTTGNSPNGSCGTGTGQFYCLFNP